MFLEMYQFHPGCQISWHVVVPSIFSQPFVFLWCQLLLLLLFHFWFYLFWYSCFFIDESGIKKNHRFCLSFQWTSYWIHWSFVWFSFFSLSFISSWILIISFLPLTVSFFCCSFSSALRCRLRLFISYFSYSWGKPVMLWTSLSQMLMLCPIDFGVLYVYFHLFLGNF